MRLLGSGLACQSSSLQRLVSTAETAENDNTYFHFLIIANFLPIGLVGGPDVFLKEWRVFSLLIDSMRSSTGVDCFLIAASFRSPAFNKKLKDYSLIQYVG